MSTIKAPAKDILNFAAHHLELGAHRVHIYLDEDQPEARHALKNHPKCRVTVTDDAYWKRRRRHKGRPDGHQHRQSLNASHCYNRNPQVDWLLHVDVDEFLHPAAPLAQMLAQVPASALSARVRPIEALSDAPNDAPPSGQTWCKGMSTDAGIRREQTNRIYPTYGDHLNGGFLSHVNGKIFVRTGQSGITLRIHNAFVDKEMDKAAFELTDCRLVHLHAHNWAHFQSLYRYRLAHGSYRRELKAAPRSGGTALTMHELFSMLEEEGGETALEKFYNEVCVATPALRDKLSEEGLLYAVELDLDKKRRSQFPDSP